MGRSVFEQLCDRYFFEDERRLEGTNVVERILKDPHAEHFAKALDMSKADFIDLMLKLASMRQGFLDKPIKIDVVNKDGSSEEVELQVSVGDGDKTRALTYRDMVSPRSGPLFGELLSEGDADDYLDKAISDEEKEARKVAVEAHLSGLDASTQAAIASYSGAIRKYLMSPRKADRKMSDLDLVAASLDPLMDAVRQALNKRGVEVNDRGLLYEIARDAWQGSGKLDIEQIEKISKDSKSRERARSILAGNAGEGELKDDDTTLQGKAKAEWTRALGNMGYVSPKIRRLAFIVPRRESSIIPGNDQVGGRLVQEDDEVGSRGSVQEDVVEEVVVLGSAMCFMAPVLARNKDGELMTDPETELYMLEDGVFDMKEHGDVVLDATSHYADFFNHKKNMELARMHVVRLIGGGEEIHQIIKEKIDEKELETQFDEVLDELISRHAEIQPDLERIKSEYVRNRKFIQCSAIFEEAAKKEAQTQDFAKTGKIDKIVGNISDISAHLGGLKQFIQLLESKDSRTEEDDRQLMDAKAHLAQVQLSFLVALPRWGVGLIAKQGAISHKDVGKPDAVTPKEYADSLNKRSHGSAGGFRQGRGWSGIGDAEAERRLVAYSDAMQEMWSFARGDGKDGSQKHVESYFTAIKNYEACFIAYEAEKKEMGEGDKKQLNDAEKAIENAIAGLLELGEPSPFASLKTKLKDFPDDGVEQEFCKQMAKQATDSVKFALGGGEKVQAVLEKANIGGQVRKQSNLPVLEEGKVVEKDGM